LRDLLDLVVFYILIFLLSFYYVYVRNYGKNGISWPIRILHAAVSTKLQFHQQRVP